MKLSVPAAILQAIQNNQWVDISYINKNNEHTSYKIGIKDINSETGAMKVDSFNYPKFGTSCDPLTMNIKNVESASAIEQSYYPVPRELKEKLESDKQLQNMLQVSELDNNILRYLSDCYKNDTDPFINGGFPVSGIDCNELKNQKKYQLDEEQFVSLLNNVFKKNIYDSEKIYRYVTLAINEFSIDINGKPFVVAYHELTLNFKDKTLKMNNKVSINKSFLIDKRKYSISSYLDMSPDEFASNFENNEREYIELIKEHFNHGEMVNTRPLLFLIRTECQRGVDLAFESIYELQSTNKLTQPLKSFFGSSRSGTGTSKEQNIVVYDKEKINIDQMRVVYNAMVNHVTYVKGPPGTGKTETIFNVILSAYANNKKVLICSNNNHPIDDIFKRMDPKFERTKFMKTLIVSFPFPIIRLGNNDEIAEKTLPYLRNAFEYASNNQKTKVNDERLSQCKNKLLSGFSELKEMLIKYETRTDIQENNAMLEKIYELTNTDQIKESIKAQIDENNEKISGIGQIKTSDVTECAISAKDNSSFNEFLDLSFLSRIKRLNNDIFDDLREILVIENQDEAVSAFNKYLADDKNLKRLTDIFPIVVCTNVASSKLGSPKPNCFDLCIMDEAGQCNIATALIPIVRASDLLLVGDTNQLQPVTVIETDLNEHFRDKYGVKKEYDYVRNSILSAMLCKDNNSKVILLRYHYRCGKLIADFCNRRFYEDQLQLLNKNPGNLFYYDVQNMVKPDVHNAYDQEAKTIVNIIKRNEYKDVGIVTPFVNQAELINKYLLQNGITDVKAGTIHTLQGSEKKVIIMSAALSLKTSKKTMEWIKNSHEMINVAVTRAKETFIFVGDRKAINLLNGKDNSDIKALSDYVYSNGQCILEKSDKILVADFSNNSASEKQFFETIKPYFDRRTKAFEIERNVLIKDALLFMSPADKEMFGQKEFDVVIKAKKSENSRYYPIIVFEIDGGEHIGSNKTIEYDKQKIKICQVNNVELIKIANSQVKDYSLILDAFQKVLKTINIEAEYKPINLLEEQYED